MAFTLIGVVDFAGGMDPEGHREYKVRYKVGTTSNQDGPAAAMQTSGLPAVGSTYAYSATELDIYAWRQPQLEVTKVPGNAEGDFPYLWYVTCTFSTKVRRQDQDQPQKPNGVEDPLSEPQKVSGSFAKGKEEAIEDRRGNPILYSSFEAIKGPLNEWDVDHDQVVIEQNVPYLGYEVFGPMKNTVNEHPLWGFPPRSIRLSGAQWRKNYGKYNNPYYTRTFTFEIRVKHDRFTVTMNFITTNGTNTIAPVSGLVTTADIGRRITGTGIPTGTTITAISSDGGLATLSNAATATSSSVALSIQYTDGNLVGDWDRDILDESAKCIVGQWSESPPYTWEVYPLADFENPADFQQCVDPSGNPIRLILNGEGVPWDSTMPEASKGKIRVERYRESNFLLLGVPLTI